MKKRFFPLLMAVTIMCAFLSTVFAVNYKTEEERRFELLVENFRPLPIYGYYVESDP